MDAAAGLVYVGMLNREGTVVESRLMASREPIAELCRRFHVVRLEVFGSALRSDFRPEESDLDFVVQFAPEAVAQYAEDYFGLKEGLESLLGRPVDLIAAGAIRNPYFRASVEAGKALLYAA